MGEGADPPEVSVVVPFIGNVYWLEEASRSVLAQTMPSLELIIVSDAPLPGIAHLTEWDTRVVILDGDATGPAAARNIGVRRARGRYVAFLDADDLFLPTKLERQITAMQSACCAFSHTSYEQVTEAGEAIATIRSGKFGGEVYPRILLRCPVATPTVVVERQLLGMTPFHEALRVADDTLLWIALARRSPLLGLDDPLTRVRMHEKNAAFNPESQLIAWRSIKDIALPQDPGLSPEIRRHTVGNIYKTIAVLERSQGRRVAALLPRLRAAALLSLDREAWRLHVVRGRARLHSYYMRVKINLSRVKRRFLPHIDQH